MKLIHLSDLHLGKRLNAFSMLDDQVYILNQILDVIDRVQPQGVLIAGDVYDKSVPPGEAIAVFDDFLVELAQRAVSVFVISGNHDSPERLAFGGRLMEAKNVYFSPVYSGIVTPIRCHDQYGSLNLYLLPFIRPAHVRRFFPHQEIPSYTDALRVVVEKMELDTSVRNVLVAHQFVTGALTSESEEHIVGSVENVDASVFASFDYVALGHLHRPQNVGCAHIRYCGAPLKYAFSEAHHQKSITVVELTEKGHVSIETVPLSPKRDLRLLESSYMELTSRSFYQNFPTTDYLHITLTDSLPVPNALGILRIIYPNLMTLTYKNRQTPVPPNLPQSSHLHAPTPLERFSAFYAEQNQQPLTDQQYQFMAQLIETVWEGERCDP